MLDALIQVGFDPVLKPLADKLGWKGAPTAGIGFVLALAGLPLAARGYLLAGIAVLIVSRAVFAFAAASARAAEAKGDLVLADILGAVSLAGYPFALALAQPAHAPACAFLVFGLTAVVAAAFAYPKDGRAYFSVGGADIVLVLVLGALLPDWLGPIAYAVGLLCLVAAGVRIDAGRK
jgi:hypothetical protein